MRLSITFFIRSFFLLAILINTPACSKDPYLESMAICEAPSSKAQKKLLHSLAEQVDMNYFAIR